MAYNNAPIVNKLWQRGLLIKKEKWEKVNEKNQEIIDIIHDENHLNQFQTPVSVFATFDSEEGY